MTGHEAGRAAGNTVDSALLVHRPYGSEHPYATTADQRVPVVPEVGHPVWLGVVATEPLVEVVCEWVAESARGRQPMRIALVRAGAAASALAAIGGEGHLAEAQAEAGSVHGDAWETTIPVEPGTRYRYRFLAVTADGHRDGTDWFTVEPVQWLAGPPAGAELRIAPAKLVPGSVSWRRARGPDGPGAADRVRFALVLAPGEHVVGFGERFDALDQRGHTPDSVVFEQYKSQGRVGRTYLPMPFAHVVGGTGWGFHVETSRRCWFDVGGSEPDRIWVEVALGGEPRVTVATYDGPPQQVLAAFGDDVGRAEMLPDWVFRLWASGNEWNTQQLVMKQMDAHRDVSIPVGAVVIEAWSDECTFTAFRDARYAANLDGSPHVAADFTYAADGAWPDPKAMIDELHARGIKVILWQIPLQRTDLDASEGRELDVTGQARADAQVMAERGLAVREADGTPYRNRGWWFPGALMPDLTDPTARAWWTDKRRYLVREYDIDGFKTDGGEHAWGHDLSFAAGRGDEVNNLFPVAYARAFGDLLRDEGKAPVTFSRAGFTGTQAHGIVWAGDEDSTWEAFRSSITAGVTASACGIVYWGWDIAGFSGPVPDAELYLRATAASTFMPIMQYHSEFNHHRRPVRDRTPWNIAEQTGDATVVDEFRRWVLVREQLVPYLVEQARAAIDDGKPLMRALLFDWPTDPRIWEFPHQYLLGDDLLISPVIRPGAGRWPVYLPAGDWVDAWTGEKCSGGRIVDRDVPIDVVPVYCRAAAWPSLAEIFA